jgi:thiol:disulfide interchange protein
MLRFSIVRIALVLIYFMLCAACGKPSNRPANTNQGALSTAGDVNFIGGGTQPPNITPAEEPYHSPSNLPSQPTALSWVSDINAAIQMAQRDRGYKIILWFRNSECAECVTIERDVFTHPDVLAASDRWIFVKIDTSLNSDRADYYLHGADPPALRFLDQQGHEYRSYNGTFTKDELVTMLRTWR